MLAFPAARPAPRRASIGPRRGSASTPREVLGELGLAREEIDRLAAAGVIVLGEQP